MNLKFVNALVTLAGFLGVVAYDGYTLAELLLIADSLLIVWGVTHYALGQVDSGARSNQSVMVIGFILLFWIAYSLKLPVAMHFPTAFWVVPDLIGSRGFQQQLPFAFFLAALGFATLLFSILSARWRAPLNWQMDRFRPRLALLFILSAVALVFKYAMKDLFFLGVPSVDPVNFSVPMLTGFTTLLIDAGFLILVNMALFAAFYTAKGWLLAAALALAFGNAGIELMFGSKDAIMFQLVITYVYVFIFGRFAPEDRIASVRGKSRIILVVTGCLGILTIVFYKFFNLYRYARISSGEDIISAISAINPHDASLSGSSLLMLWNRVSGLEVLSAVISLEDRFRYSFGPLDMVTGSVTREFTFLVIGTLEANTLFGTTQFGYFYIAGGILGMVIGLVLLGRFYVFLQNLVVNARVDNHARIAALPILWLFMAKVLLGGGNLILVAKEFFVFVLVFWICAKFLYRGPRPNRAPSIRAGVQSPA